MLTFVSKSIQLTLLVVNINVVGVDIRPLRDYVRLVLGEDVAVVPTHDPIPAVASK